MKQIQVGLKFIIFLFRIFGNISNITVSISSKFYFLFKSKMNISAIIYRYYLMFQFFKKVTRCTESWKGSGEHEMIFFQK